MMEEYIERASTEVREQMELEKATANEKAIGRFLLEAFPSEPELAKAFAEGNQRLSAFEGEFNGFRFAFPKDFKDFREQAETLGNCLISNEYYLRHAKGKCVIVFVLKDGKRVGTADVTGGEVRQFTGNQRAGSWKPSAPMLAAMDAFMERNGASL